MGIKITFSTDPAWCPACQEIPCACKKPDGKPRQTEPVRLSFRRTGKGSGVTLIEKLQMHPAGKEELVTRFKKKFGVGGTVKFGVLEIQGDRRAQLGAELSAMGYKIKTIT